MASGVCRLTGERGKFARAHIFPLALTRPAERGAALIQAGEGTRPVRRWTSWYDEELVTAAGERVLADYDDKAIKELRKQRLIWSGWGSAKEIASDQRVNPGSPYGLRRLKTVDSVGLRLFYLSLLWRAAATRRSEFAAIQVQEEDMDLLRQLILSGDPGDPGFYPVHLTQISTLGAPHNQTPLAEERPVPSRGAMVTEPSYRFYFDGLIAHIGRVHLRAEELVERAPFVLGAEMFFCLPTVTWEISRQRDAATTVMSEYARNLVNNGRVG